MRTTIADVATRAGVSKTTVSRVLNGKADVDAATASRVNRVIDELGYVPSFRAVGLARGRTGAVGMLVPSLSWPWVAEVVQGVSDALEEAGHGMLLYTGDRGQESLNRFATSSSGQAYDGLILVTPEHALDYVTDLHRTGVPVVMVDDRGLGPNLPTVATTNRQGGADVASHLLEHGRTSPLVITGPMVYGYSRERLRGFQEVYAQAGHPITADRIAEGDLHHRRGRSTIAAKLHARVPFDAVFAHTDLTAAGALTELHRHGVVVPDDVSVVGFDDSEVSWHTDPTLTTVHQPMREMGRTATRILLASFGGTPLPTAPVLLPTTLIARESTLGLSPALPPEPPWVAGPPRRIGSRNQPDDVEV
jgi:LacI family transcriptional regulator